MNLIKKNYGFKKINSQRKKDAIKINELNKITKIFGKKHTGTKHGTKFSKFQSLNKMQKINY